MFLKICWEQPWWITQSSLFYRSYSVCAGPWSALVWWGWVWPKWCLFGKRMLWVHTGSTTTAAWTVSSVGKGTKLTEHSGYWGLGCVLHKGQRLRVLNGVVPLRAKTFFILKIFLKFLLHLCCRAPEMNGFLSLTSQGVMIHKLNNWSKVVHTRIFNCLFSFWTHLKWSYYSSAEASANTAKLKLLTFGCPLTWELVFVC